MRDELMPRGCGGPRPGKCYLTLKFSQSGVPFRNFILDPVMPIPNGISVRDRGMDIIEIGGRKYVADHVGSNYYPNPADWLEEVGRLGLHQLIEKSFPFKNMNPEMWIMFSHSQALVNDIPMLLKYYERAGRDEDSNVRTLRACPNSNEEKFNFHQYAGDSAAKAGEWCAGLHWDALTKWDEKGDQPDVKRQMPAFTYRGKEAIKGTEFHDGFILALPLSALKFRVYEDPADGEHKETLKALGALPNELKSQVQLMALQESGEVEEE